MSLDIYNELQNSHSDYLPLMKSGNLHIESRKVKKDELPQFLLSINKTEDSWFMYTDEIKINPFSICEPEKNLLEAELRTEDSSIHIRYLQNDLYAITTYSENLSEKNDNLAYYEQSIHVRQDLQSNSGCTSVKYRLWYEREEKESNSLVITSGRWKGFVQQFLGFRKLED